LNFICSKNIYLYFITKIPHLVLKFMPGNLKRVFGFVKIDVKVEVDELNLKVVVR